MPELIPYVREMCCPDECYVPMWFVVEANAGSAGSAGSFMFHTFHHYYEASKPIVGPRV